MITRRGKAVSRMVPPDVTFDRESGRRAASRIRAMRRGVTLGGLALKDLVGESRL